MLYKRHVPDGTKPQKARQRKQEEGLQQNVAKDAKILHANNDDEADQTAWMRRLI